MQYRFFGDVITFDTTYRTKLYNMPFGLFVGVNNHFQSIILAGVLMRGEQEETFEWVSSEFVLMMGGPAPRTILIGKSWTARYLCVGKSHTSCIADDMCLQTKTTPWNWP